MLPTALTVALPTKPVPLAVQLKETDVPLVDQFTLKLWPATIGSGLSVTVNVGAAGVLTVKLTPKLAAVPLGEGVAVMVPL